MAEQEETGRGVDRLDTSAASDLLEQQQAMEQSRLLHRFRELRQWQLQQQESLMHQQRSQLEMLKHEQVKVQTMLTKEREMQWGGGKVIRQQGGISPTKTPPQRRPPVPANNELFSALMTLVGSQDPLAVTMEQSVTQSQASFLPMPVMYGPPEPVMDDTSTNPELLSSPGSRTDYQAEVMEDGVCPIPDTISEISDGSYLPHVHKKNFIRTQPFLGDMASDTASVRSDGSYIPPKQTRMRQNGNKLHYTQDPMSPDAASLLQTLLQTANADTLMQMLGLAQPERVVISDNPRSVKPRTLLDGREGIELNENCSSSVQYQQREMSRDVRERPPRGDNHVRHQGELSDRLNGHDGRKPSHSEEYYREVDYSERDFNKRHYDLQRLLPEAQGEGQRTGRRQVIDDIVIEEDSQLEESDIQDITVEEVKESTPLGIDDRPIKTGIGGKKSFEQLMEEQIRQEEERLRAESTDSPSVKKKAFLRKGQGLSRYGPGKKKSSPKQAHTSSSSEQVTESRPIPDQRPSKTTASKAIQKPKKPQPATQSHKPGKDQQTSSQTKYSKKELSPRQKSQTKSKLSPRQKIPPKHSTPTGSDSPPSPAKGSSLQVKDRRTGTVGEPFADDVSFVGKIRKIEENKKVEEKELEVFELLEDFADNVSFCSNSSVVSRLLQRGKEENMTNVEGVKAVIEAKKAEKEMKMNQQGEYSENTNHKHDREIIGFKHANEVTSNYQDSHRISPPRERSDRDSSLIDGVDLDTSSDTITESSSSESSDDEEENRLVTPKKKDGNAENVRNSYEALFDQSQEDGFMFVNNRNVDSNMFRSSDSEVRSSVPLSPTKSLTRKIATKDARYSSSSDTQSILNRLAASADDLTSRVSDSNKQEEFSSFEKQAMVNDMFGDSKVTVGLQHDTLSSSDEESDDSITKVKGQVRGESHDKVISPGFDDEDEWTVTAPQTQVAILDKEEAKAGTEQSTPPTSRLVARLFPKLKNANQMKLAEKQEQEQQKLQAVTKATVGDGVQSKILRDKLAELEKEIEKFRNENASLEKLRKDREELLSKLKQEICDFEKEKDEEVRRLEEFRTQEMKKLKQERKLFEQYQKTVRSMPDKREREEIDALKRQLSELQDEVKKKEGRWTSASNRLRQRLEVVEMENKELKEEIKLLEKRRLEVLQRETQKKNGIQKSFPRSSTPTEDLTGGRLTSEAAVVNNTTSLSHDSTLRPSVHHTVVNSSIQKSSQHAPVSSQSQTHNLSSIPRPSQHSLAPNSAHNHVHNVSGDAIPRGQPSRPSSVPGSDSQSPDDASSVGAVVNLPRKQSAKFSLENPSIDKGDREYEETQYPDGKVERTYTNGAREILFANGTRKEISSDGQSIVVSFFNGDIKQIFPDQRVVYFYADAQTTHTTYPDGLEILQFQNNQIEKHYPDGTKEITFPDQTIKYLFPNGSEESIFPDGTVIRVEKNGDKTMEFPNGQREIHTEAYKRREYPDGTVKTVYPDGRQETRYSTGRIRLKDKDGNVIMDRMC